MDSDLSGYVSESVGTIETLDNTFREHTEYSQQVQQNILQPADLQEIRSRFQDLRSRVTDSLTSLKNYVLGLSLSASTSDLKSRYVIPEPLAGMLDSNVEVGVPEAFRAQMELMEWEEQFTIFCLSLPWPLPEDVQELSITLFYAVYDEATIEGLTDWIPICRTLLKLSTLRCRVTKARFECRDQILCVSVEDFLYRVMVYIFNNRNLLKNCTPPSDSGISTALKPLMDILDWKNYDVLGSSWEMMPEYYNDVAFKSSCAQITGDRSVIRFLWPMCPSDLEEKYSLTLRRLLNQDNSSEPSKPENPLRAFEEEGVTDTETMLKPGVWADHLQVVKLAAFLHRPIRLLRHDDSSLSYQGFTLVPGQDFQIEPTSSTVASTDALVDESSGMLVDDVTSILEPVTLFFTPETHYEVLIPIARYSHYAPLYFLDELSSLSDLQQPAKASQVLRLAADAILNGLFSLYGLVSSFKLSLSRVALDHTQVTENLNDIFNLITRFKQLVTAIPDEFLLLLTAEKHAKLHLWMVSDVFEDPTEIDQQLPQSLELGPFASLFREFYLCLDHSYCSYPASPSAFIEGSTYPTASFGPYSSSTSSQEKSSSDEIDLTKDGDGDGDEWGASSEPTSGKRYHYHTYNYEGTEDPQCTEDSRQYPYQPDDVATQKRKKSWTGSSTSPAWLQDDISVRAKKRARTNEERDPEEERGLAPPSPSPSPPTTSPVHLAALSGNSPPYKLYDYGYGYFNNPTLPPNTTDDLPAELLDNKIQFQNYQPEGGEVGVTVGQVGKSEEEGKNKDESAQHQYATFDPLENLHKALLQQEQEQEKWRENCSTQQTTPTEPCTNVVTGNSLASLLGPAQVLDYGSSCDSGLRDEDRR